MVFSDVSFGFSAEKTVFNEASGGVAGLGAFAAADPLLALRAGFDGHCDLKLYAVLVHVFASSARGV